MKNTNTWNLKKNDANLFDFKTNSHNNNECGFMAHIFC